MTHGIQVSGANYLVPVSANATREADVDFQMLDVNLVLRQMQGSGTRLNMSASNAKRPTVAVNKPLRMPSRKSVSCAAMLFAVALAFSATNNLPGI